MNDDDIGLGDLGLADPERPLPRGSRPPTDLPPAATTPRHHGERVSFLPPPDVELSAPVDVTPPFERVPIADIMDSAPDAPSYWWQGLVPAGHVTLLGAHGGTGKSMLGLMLSCAMATGLPLFGIATRRATVAFFSAEDPASVVRHRLHLICRAMDIDPSALDKRLHVLDATAGDPALFREVAAAGMRHGAHTPTCAALIDYLEEHDIDVLIVDNASDTYDASEIDRARVRAFMRNLSNMAQPDRAVLLLAHVDKGTSRGDRTGTEGYSGSTAWHNSARSRLYLSRDKDGALLLEHQKHNLGKMHEPLRLLWPEGGIPTLDAPVEGVVQRIADGTDTKALLRLLATFYGRGEYVATDTRSRYHAVKVLGDDPAFPKRRKPNEVFAMLRDAEGRGLIEREEYRNGNRKQLQRWALTNKGADLLGIVAPSAPSAPSSLFEETENTAQRRAPSAPSSARGVRGEGARAELGAAGLA